MAQYVPIRALHKNYEPLGTEQTEALQNAPDSSQQVCPPSPQTQVEHVTLLNYHHTFQAMQDRTIISK